VAPFVVGERLFALNPKFSDGTRLRGGPHRDAPFLPEAFIENDGECTVVATVPDSPFVQIQVGSHVGWILTRNLTRTQRRRGLSRVRGQPAPSSAGADAGAPAVGSAVASGPSSAPPATNAGVAQGESGPPAPRPFDGYDVLPVEVPGVGAGTGAGAGVGAGAARAGAPGAGWRVGGGVQGSRLPLIHFKDLVPVRALGVGSFGSVDHCVWGGGTDVAVKANGIACADAAAIDRERGMYERLLVHPHPNIVQVFGLCVDAPDGKMRLVMRLCAKGSLYALLVASQKQVRVAPPCSRASSFPRCSM
jgi:hypothetical protein